MINLLFLSEKLHVFHVLDLAFFCENNQLLLIFFSLVNIFGKEYTIYTH